jgi:hypothetical protein
VSTEFTLSTYKVQVTRSRILTMETLQLPWSRHCLLVNTSHLNSQLNCSASCLHDNSSARTARKHSPSVVEACLPRRCIVTIAARTTYKTAFFYCCLRICCGRCLQSLLFTESLLSNGSIRHIINTHLNLSSNSVEYLGNLVHLNMFKSTSYIE